MSDIFPSSTIRSYASKFSPTNTLDKINIVNDRNIFSSNQLSLIQNNEQNSSNNSTPTQQFTLPSLIIKNKAINGPCNICKIDKSPFWEESMGIVYCKDCFKKSIDKPTNNASSINNILSHNNSSNQSLPSFSQLPSINTKKFKDSLSKSFSFDEDNINSTKQQLFLPNPNPPNTSHSQPIHLPPSQEHKQPESYYCKYCEKTYPSSSFKNIQAFGAHCSNCSRKRKIRDDGFSFVPEMGSFEHQHQSSTSSTSNHQLPLQSLLKYRKIENESIDSSFDPRNSSVSSNNDDTHRIPYSSPFSPQSSPGASPRMQIDDGSLRFGLLDVIEDKLAEENELELIRKDLKNISNEIAIQDIQRERDMHDLSNNLIKELHETQSRMCEDIAERMKTEEIEFSKIKDKFIKDYLELEKELNDLIVEQQRTSKTQDNDDDSHHELNDSSDELKIDDGNDSIHENHSNKQQATEQSSKIKIDIIKPTKNDEIVKKIESIKKLMNEKIMQINLQLKGQGRELERLVSLESNEFEKHSVKKFDDIKNNVNETTDALVNSFEILDKILISQK